MRHLVLVATLLLWTGRADAEKGEALPEEHAKAWKEAGADVRWLEAKRFHLWSALFTDAGKPVPMLSFDNYEKWPEGLGSCLCRRSRSSSRCCGRAERQGA